MDRALPKEAVRKNQIRKSAVILVPLILLVLLILVIRSLLTPALCRSEILTAVAENGAIESTITATGVVVPAFEQVITSPIQSTVSEVYLRSGDDVSDGESLLRLNQEFIQMSLDKLIDELELQKNKRRQLILQLERVRIDLQAEYDIKELRTRFAESEYEREKHLYDIGGTTKGAFARAELNLEIARREMEQLSSRIDNQRASLEAELSELDIRMRIQNNSINEVKRQIELTEARADRHGVVTWINDDIGATVNAGDVLARIADLGSYRIEARISDVHAAKVKVGVPVRVRVNDRRLNGSISSVRPSVENGIVTFLVELEDKSDPSLRPQLRADVFVVTAVKDNVIRVPNGAFYTGAIDQPVFVIEGDRAVSKAVEIGESNYDYVELLGEIELGDEVIVSDMSEHKHQDAIDIKDD